MEYITHFCNTSKRFYIILFLTSICYSSLTFLSAQEACPIYTAIETNPTDKSRSARQYTQYSLGTNTPLWTNLDNIVHSDDEYARVVLSGFQKPNVITASDLKMNLPSGASISGLEISIEGHTSGAGQVRDINLQLLNSNGQLHGNSLAGTGGSKSWFNGTTDYIWSYGGANETWGLDLNSELLNDPNFGFELFVRNSLSSDIEIFIDQILVTVYFEPLYGFCDHTCVTFYIDELNEQVTYNWLLPQGFELLSLSEKSHIIDIGVSYASFGTHELCVETIKDGQVTGLCCRKFNYLDCINATIGDQVWNDLNYNHHFDSGDQPMSNIEIHLFDDDDNLISSQRTDINGKYKFDVSDKGGYYVKLDIPSGFVPVFAGIGDENSDSDLTNTFGLFTSDLITLESDTIIENIDFGISEALYIGDQVWEDINGDGIYQLSEPAIEGVKVKILSNYGHEFNDRSDANGEYSIGPLPLGSYEVIFENPILYIPTLKNVGNNKFFDSDINALGSTGMILFDESGSQQDFDAGYYKNGTIGDFLWEDLNNNGIQELGEPGISNIEIKLLKNGEIIETTTTGSNGDYEFIVSPGEYTLEIENIALYRPTLSKIGNPTKDSDLIPANGKYITEEILVQSGDNRNDIDLGLFNIPSSIGGITWLDSDSDGQFDNNEQVLAGIEVFLHNVSGAIIANTITDSNGEYLFDLLPANNYFVSFDIEDDRLFTNPNLGNDSSDSDVTSSQLSGSTDIIILTADTDLTSVYAGYLEKADIGDQVWLDLNRDGLNDANEPGVKDIIVILVNQNGGFVENTSTDENGYYQFKNIDPGTYSIQFRIDESYDYTSHNIGNDDNIDSDVISFTTAPNGSKIGTTASIIVNTNDDISNIDAGIILKLGSISGKVFNDSNADGMSTGESFVAGIEVGLLNEQQEIVKITSTDARGAYLFDELSAGIYYVVFEIQNRYSFTEANMGSDNIDSDVTEIIGTGSTDAINVTDAVDIKNIDAGIIDGIRGIIGLSWVDKNGDGIRSSNEDLLSGVTVSLFEEGSNQPLRETLTDEDGYYVFDNALAGSYYIKFEVADYIATFSNQGINSNIDSDITNENGLGTTAIFEHYFFSNTVDIDAGYYKLATIGDFLWEDINKNGQQDLGEPGISGVTVDLLSATSQVLASTTTNQQGKYEFSTIPGTYSITTSIEDFVLTSFGVGPTNTNSDFQNINGVFSTEHFMLMSGEENKDIDAGFIPADGSLSGVVFLDENENGIDDENSVVPGIIIKLYNENQELVRIVESNFDGEYNINGVSPGNYYLVFEITDRFRFTNSNIGSDNSDSDVSETITTGSTSLISVGNGENIENVDAGLIMGLSSLSGIAWIDSDANGIRSSDEPTMPNVLVEAFNSNGQIVSSAITDTDGQYQMSDLISGLYFLVFTPSDEAYIVTSPDIGNDSFDSDVTHNFVPGSTDLITIDFFEEQHNIDVGYYKYASIGDQVWIDENNDNIKNSNESGLNNVTIHLLDDNNVVLQSTLSTNDGNYIFENLRPGNYKIQFELLENYKFVQENAGAEESDSDVVSINGSIGTTETITLSSNETNFDLDAGVFLDLTFTSSIAGSVWKDSNSDGLSEGEEPIEGRLVSLYTSTGTLITSVQTDADGDYKFTMVDAGSYFVKVDLLSDDISTIPNIGFIESIDSDFTDENGPGTSTLFQIANLEEKSGVDLGIGKRTSVTGQVWNDTNNDGQNNNQESGHAGVEVKIESLTGDLIRYTTTDDSGVYTFSEMPSFMYKITFTAPAGNSFTLQNIGDNSSDSDVDQLLGSTNLDFTAGGDFSSVDAGLIENSNIGGFIWVDVNGNAQLGANEPRLNNYEVNLYSENGVLVQSTTTSSGPLGAGHYTFSDVIPGDYYIVFQIPEQYSIALPDIGDDNLDNDITGGQGTRGSTDIFTVGAAETLSNISAGIYLPSSLGDRVFLDENKNGIQDDNEGGVQGVEVILYQFGGAALDTVYTDENGYYSFNNVTQGQYTIEFIVPEEYMVSPFNQGLDDDIDNDADPTGTIFLVSLAHGTAIDNLDMGIYLQSTNLRSVVWLDENVDGLRQHNEARISGLFITLLDEQKNIVDWTFTNELGKYAFQNMEEGKYYVHIETSSIEYLISESNSTNNLFNNDLLYSGYSEMFSVNNQLSVPNVDAGMLMPSTIKVEVWEEKEVDGFLSEDELPLKNIMAELIDENGNICAMKMSEKEEIENVKFDKVRPGIYHIRYSNDYNYQPSLLNQTDVSDTDNSDIIESNGYFVSPSFEIGVEETVDYLDAGFYLEPSIAKAKHDDDKLQVDEGLEFNIGPNPAMYYIELTNVKDSDDKYFDITLMNRDGKIVYENTIQNPQNYRISIENLKSGMYYLNITDKQQSISSSLLKITP